MCNPNLFGAILARLTRDQRLDDVAHRAARRDDRRDGAADPHRRGVRGARLHQRRAARSPGCRSALGCDADISYGVPPIEQRERWREAIDLMLKAWTAKEFFAWNGKYYQLPKVNLWPRPVQDPHPPLLVPGRQLVTWDYCHERDLPYAYLSYFGGKSAKTIMDGFWEPRRGKGPRRKSLPRLVPAAGRRRRHRRRRPRRNSASTSSTSTRSCLHSPPQYIAPPGYSDYKSLLELLHAGEPAAVRRPRDAPQAAQGKGHDRAKGSSSSAAPRRCASSSRTMAKRLNVGHLMVVLQFGSMPHELGEEEHRTVRPRGPAAPAEALGDDELGEPLVAETPAPRAKSARRCRRGESSRPCSDDDGPGRPSRSTTAISRPRSRSAATARRSSTCTPPAGPRWDPFLDALAEHTRSTRPTTRERARPPATAIHAVDGLWDLVLIYDEMLDALGLDRVPLIGASFGGMVACEVAAHAPRAGLASSCCSTRSGCGATTRRSREYMMMTPRRAARRRCSTTLSAPPVQAVLVMPERPGRARGRRSPTRSGRWARPASSCGRSRTRA